jgi:AcrR family transcriptional regulator
LFGIEVTMPPREEDRRVRRTRQLLHQALLSLIQEKGFERLSVQNILDRANVGRATFYAHFDSKEDLLVSGIEGLRASLRELQHRSGARKQEPFAFSRELFEHANAHRAVFQAMVGKKSGAIIQQSFHKMLVDLMRDEVHRNEPVARFLAGGLYGLVIWWVDGRMRLTVDEVDALFRRMAIPALESAA